MAAEHDLVGRDAECSAIDGLLADAAALRSGCLLIEGEVGAGKSALLGYAAARAGDLRVLRAEGVEPESDLAFAGLHQLLRPVLDRLAALPGAQAAALRGALGLGPQPADRFLVGVGVLSVLAEAAADHGLLCLLDDVQWLDRESADALLFAARRLEAEGVAVLFAVRDDGGSQDGRPAFPALGIPRMRIDGLRPADAAVLLRRAGTDLSPAVLDRVIELADGNPLALLELPGGLSAAQRTGAEPLPAHLPVGERIRRAYLDRVARLPEPSQLLLLLAAAEPNGDLGLLSRAAQHLGVDVAALDPPERAGLVVLGPDGVRFRHPLLRSAIYTAAPYLRRRAVHAALAEALGDAEPDRWAWHRAVVADRPDPVLADELERSADRARARGGTVAAAAALERAAELTVDGGHRARRLVGAATAVWEAGQAERAERLLAQAERLEPPARLLAEIGYLRGGIELHTRGPARAVTMLRAAAAQAAPEDPVRSLGMLTSALMAVVSSGALGQVGELVELARRLPASGPEAVMAALLVGLERLVSGDPAGAADQLGLFIDYARRLADPLQLYLGGSAAFLQGDEVLAGELYERGVAAARQTGAVGLLPTALHMYAMIEVVTGQLSRAEADAREAMRLAEELGQGLGWTGAVAVLAAVAALRGRQQECRSFAEQAMAAAEQRDLALPWALAAAALAELELSLGRPERALDRLRRLADTAHPGQLLAPIFTTPERVEAMVHLGEPVDPAELAPFEAWVQYSRSKAMAARAARCRAMLATDDAAPPLFEEAIALHEAAGRPLERARTQLLYGEFLRRQRRRTEARTQLRAAVETLDRLGALAWAERARTELRATGETVAAREVNVFDQLTPQELQIVRLVGDGMSNRQVAAQLFLSPRTVEYHLRKVYPKLNISSRSELIRRYAAAAGTPTGGSADSGPARAHAS